MSFKKQKDIYSQYTSFVTKKQIKSLPDTFPLTMLQQKMGVKYDSTFRCISLPSAQFIKNNSSLLLEQKNNELSIEKQMYEIKKIRSRYFPKLILNGSIGSGYSENNKIADANGQLIPKPFGTQLNENFYQSASATINIPIFNGNKTRNEIKINELELERIKLKNERIEYEKNNTILKIKIEINNSEHLYTSSKKMFESLNIEYENNQIRYEQGILNYIDLIKSRNELYNAKSKMIQAKYQLEYNKIILSFFE